VIIQDDRFDATGSVTVCAFTSDPTDAPLIRLLVDPDGSNGIREPSRLMVDKITTTLGPRWETESDAWPMKTH
jgi:mRNA interferase MazF